MIPIPLPPSDQLAKLREYVEGRRAALRTITPTAEAIADKSIASYELLSVLREIDRLAKEGQS